MAPHHGFRAELPECILPVQEGALLTRLLETARCVLNPQEYYVVALRYGLCDARERTLKEVGGAIQLSRERVRQIETHAFSLLGRALSIGEDGQMDCPSLGDALRELLEAEKPGFGERAARFVDEQLYGAIGILRLVLGCAYKRSVARAACLEYREYLGERARTPTSASDIRSGLARLLAGVIWPVSPGFFGADVMMEMVQEREVSEDGYGRFGNFVSQKTRRTVAYESLLELGFYQQLEQADCVVSYQVQPLKVALGRGDGPWDHLYPDVLFLLQDGTAVVAEVKTLRLMALYKNLLKRATMLRYCAEHGYGYITTDGRYVFQDLERTEVLPSKESALIGALEEGPLRWAPYQELSQAIGMTRRELSALIVKHGLIWTLKPWQVRARISARHVGTG